MLDQNTTTILSQLLGGTLTIAGGFIATYFTQKSIYNQTKIKESKDKIENISNLLIQVTEFFSDEIIEFAIKDKDISPEEVLEKIKWLNRCLVKIDIEIYIYMTRITRESEKYKKILTIQTGDFYAAYTKKDEKKMEEAADLIRAANDRLLTAIIKLANKKGYSYF